MSGVLDGLYPKKIHRYSHNAFATNYSSFQSQFTFLFRCTESIIFVLRKGCISMSWVKIEAWFWRSCRAMSLGILGRFAIRSTTYTCRRWSCFRYQNKSVFENQIHIWDLSSTCYKTITFLVLETNILKI